MPTPLPTYQSLFNTKSRQRGTDYYHNGAVTHLTCQTFIPNEQTWTATVQGTERYKTKILLAKFQNATDWQIEHLHCTCEYDYDGYCKHLFATLTAIEQQLENQLLQASYAINNDSNIQLLAKMDNEALQQYIRFCWQKSPELATELALWLNQFYPDVLKTAEPSQNEPNPTLALPTDSVVLASLYQKIDAILQVENIDEMFWEDYEFDFSEQTYEFKRLLEQFAGKPNYQLKAVVYWLEQVITHFYEIPDGDLDYGFEVAFHTLGEILFGEKNYLPTWDEHPIRYLDHATPAQWQYLQKNLEVWLDDGNLADSYNARVFNRFYFDMLLTHGQVSEAMALLDEQIARCERNRYSNYELTELLPLKIALLYQLNLAEQIEPLRQQYAYLPKIRQLIIDEKLAQGNIDEAIALIEQGIKIAQTDNHWREVEDWKKQLLTLAKTYQRSDIVRKQAHDLAFERGNISVSHFQTWKDSFTPAEWLTARLEKQTELSKKIKPKKLGNISRFSFDFSPDENLQQLAHFYALEGQHDELAELLKRYQNKDLTDKYLRTLATAQADWVVDFYTDIWQQQVALADSRKNYTALAQDIAQKVNNFPQGKDKWQTLVNGWLERFKSKPRRPALLEELGKINW